jgi:hypothetical protein
MDKMYFSFEIVVLLFKDGHIKKISKNVPSIYQETYREVGYKMAENLISEGWRVYSISIDNIHIESALEPIEY